MKHMRKALSLFLALAMIICFAVPAFAADTDTATGQVTRLAYPQSDVLYFKLEGGHFVCIRPSGTEPKIKVYILTLGKDAEERNTNICRT